MQLFSTLYHKLDNLNYDIFNKVKIISRYSWFIILIIIIKKYIIINNYILKYNIYALLIVDISKKYINI